MPEIRNRCRGTEASGELAAIPAGPGSGDGIDRTVLETGVAGVGAAFPETASGTSTIQRCAERTQERFSRCQASDQATALQRTEAELCTGAGTTHVAVDVQGQAATDAGADPLAVSAGSVTGGGSHETVKRGQQPSRGERTK